MSRHARTISNASASSCQRRCRVTGSAITSCDETRCLAEHVDDSLLLLARDAAPERQAEVVARGLLGLGQVALGVAEVAQRRLQVQRRRVVRGARDAGLGQRSREPVALGRAHGVHVVDVAGLVLRQLRDLAEAELGVERGRLAAQARPLVEVRQEDPQRRGLDRVEARVVADVLERPSSPASRGSAACGCGRRASASLTAIRPPSPSAKRFFDGKKLNVETTLVAIPCEPNACAASSISGRPKLAQLRDRRRPAEQVHGHDRLRPLGDPRARPRPGRGSASPG